MPALRRLAGYSTERRTRCQVSRHVSVCVGLQQNRRWPLLEVPLRHDDDGAFVCHKVAALTEAGRHPPASLDFKVTAAQPNLA